MSKWRWEWAGGGQWRVVDTEREAREAEQARAVWSLLANSGYQTPAAAQMANAAIVQQGQAVEAYRAQQARDAALWNRYASAMQGNPLGPFLPGL